MKVLYFGLELSAKWYEQYREVELIHCPLITIEAKSLDDVEIMTALEKFKSYTHILLTSKTAVKLCFEAIEAKKLKIDSDKKFITVGQATAQAIERHGCQADFIASDECSEGIVSLLDQQDFSSAHIFWPCSALSRNVIPEFCRSKGIKLSAVPFYTTITNHKNKALLHKELPDASELIFTSPSTVKAFLDLYGPLPKDKKITSIGPVTSQALLCN